MIGSKQRSAFTMANYRILGLPPSFVCSFAGDPAEMATIKKLVGMVVPPASKALIGDSVDKAGFITFNLSVCVSMMSDVPSNIRRMWVRESVLLHILIPESYCELVE